jgi:hypothetical protein
MLTGIGWTATSDSPGLVDVSPQGPINQGTKTGWCQKCRPLSLSKPPSSDGLGKPAPKSLRERTGRGPGRPPEQPGTTLRQVSSPNAVVRHVPTACGGCGDGLSGGVEVRTAVRQVFDIPEPAIVVTEHQIVTMTCPCSDGPEPSGGVSS